MRRGSQSGIIRRLARVILLQLLFISVITALGVIVAAKVVEGVMMRAALEGEATHFWSQYEDNQGHPLPNTDNLTGYLSLDGDLSELPSDLAGETLGYGRVHVDGRDVLVLVDSRTVAGQEARLFLVFDEESVTRLSFFFGVVPLSLILIVIYFSAWYAFRQTSKAISPVVKLAGRLKEFQTRQDNRVELDLENLKTGDVDDEINILVDSLQNFTEEINHLIERERQFTRDASHELRTPLTVIRGSAESLELTSDLTTSQQAAIDRIKRTTSDMTELVTSLLLLARGSKGSPSSETFLVNEVVEHQLDQLQLTHNADRHVEIEVQIRDEISVTAPRQLAEAVIGNVLRNAINYTRKGYVEVVVENNQLECANRGEGVIEMDSEKMFEPFSRGSANNDSSGYGVGLDLVRRLCALLGWEVSGRYSIERGMIFTLSF